MMLMLLILAQSFWIETTQQNFADGIHERNIYASHLDGGTIEFAPRFDLNNDGYIEIVTCDIGGPYVTLYWGGSSGYNPGNTTVFPSTGAADCDVADVNNDGYSDFIVTHANSDSRLAIYYGSPTGPSPGNVFNIANSSLIPNEVAYAADLNKDGYLDIIIGMYFDLNLAAIFWGRSSGYNPSDRTELPGQGSAHNTEVADLNKDNWLDIIIVNGMSFQNYIYWGSVSGYSPGNMTALAAPPSTPHGSSVADLNDDGYLDLVFTSVYDSQSYLYYGSASGYVTYQALNTGSTYGGSAVCNINDDEYLDLIFFGGWPSALKPVIYWGSSTGYSDANKSEIGYAVNGDGGFVADLNGDDYSDIFVNSRSPNSSIFWGPDYTTSTSLPVNNDHHGMFREIGNTYNREYYEDYLSSVFDAGEDVNWGIVEWDDSLPPETDILFYVRSGNTPNPDSTWSGWDSLGNGDEVADSLNSQYLQYRTRLTYTNPSYLPYLYEVRIGYGPSMKIILEPDQADSTLPAVAVDYDISVINIGMGLDTVDLVYQHNTTWQVILFDSTGTNPLIDHNNNGLVDVIIDSDDTILIVLEVTPPSTAQGGDVDSLTLIGTSNIMPSMNDSVRILTSIRKLVSILVEPDQIDSTVSGVPISFNLLVYNNGTNHDTVDLYYNHNKPWGVSLLDSTGTSPLIDHNNNGIPDVSISSFDSVGIIVVVYPPDTAQFGEVDTLTLTGRSTLDPQVSDDATLITIIRSAAGTIIVFPDQTNSGLPGNWVNFSLVCRNNQNFVDTIDLAVQDQLGWSYNLLDSLGNPLIDHNNNGLVDLPGIDASGGEADFSAEIFIPSGTASGTVDSILLFGYSGKDTTIKDSASLVLTVGDYARVLIEPDCADSGNYGDSIDYRLQVQNLGNNADVIDLYTIGGILTYSLRDRFGNLLIDTNNNGIVDLGTIPPLSSESLIVRVNITSSQIGLIDTVVVRAVSSINTSVYDDAEIATRIIGSVWGLTLEPDQGARVEPGYVVSLPVDALLQGSIADVVDLEIDPVLSDWQVTLLDSTSIPLTDTDNDGLLDLGAVLPEMNHRFYVQVSAPAQFSLVGQVDSLANCAFYVHGKCSYREDITDSVHISVQLVPRFDVHNFRNPFKYQTQFIFSLPKAGHVTLDIYNRAGEMVRRLINNRSYNFGIHYYPWNGKNNAGEDLAPGIYIYILNFRANDGDERIAKKKAVMLK